MLKAPIEVSYSGLLEEDWTLSHEKRVTEICEVFASVLKLDDSSTQDLMTVGVVHDIGKTFVPASILNKPGDLSPYEYKEMQRHTEYGYQALLMTENKHLAESVLFHHERYDGKGYPQGLRGKEIPLYSRIVAIIDAYDAMTNDRPYRRAMSCEAAVNELLKESGNQFDPVLVELFINQVLPLIKKR